jgi:hypothetical protein
MMARKLLNLLALDDGLVGAIALVRRGLKTKGARWLCRLALSFALRSITLFL